MVSFTIGCDPEVFVKSGNKVIGANGLVPGDKKNPHKVVDGAIQVDGMALEFNTDPVPAQGHFNTFNRKVISVIRQLKEAAGEGLSISRSCVAEFDEEYLASMPEEARELGCDPDFNAYTMRENPRPDAVVNFRTAAGHVHFGWGENIPVNHPQHMEICANFVKVLDLTLGLPATVIEGPNKRRELYGKAGAFRPKPYGVEYRTPSNFWIFSKLLREGVYQAGAEAINLLTRFETAENVYRHLGNSYSEEIIQEVINTSDVEKAKMLYPRCIWNHNTLFCRAIYDRPYA